MLNRIISLKYRSRSVFPTLLLSYLIILLLPILIGNILYGRIVSSLEEEAGMSNKVMLQQVSQVVDDQLKSVNKLVLEISGDPAVGDFFNAKEDLNAEDRLKIVKILMSLGAFKNANYNFINDFYMYFKDSKIIVNANGKYDLNVFYNVVYHYKDIDFNTWVQDILKREYAMNYISTRINPEKNPDEYQIIYVQSIPFGEKYNTKATLVLHLNENYIKNLLEKIEGLDKREVCVIDSHSNILFSTNTKLFNDMNVKQLKNMDSVINGKSNKEEWVVTYDESRVNDWKYAVLTPKSIFMSKVKYIKSLAMWETIFNLIFGVVLAYILASKNYRPLKNILGTIFRASGSSSLSGTNEYDYIAKCITDAFSERQNLSNTLKEQTPLVKANLFKQLLEGRLDVKTNTDKNLDMLDVVFRYQYFMVVSVQVGCFQFTRELINDVFIEIYKILDRMNFTGYLVEMEQNAFCIILNLPEEVAADLKSRATPMFDDIKSFMLSQGLSDFTIGIGSVKNQINGLNVSYAESLKAAQYKLVMGKGMIIYYGDTCTDSHQSYFYPMEVELQIINNVKAGEIEKANSLLNEIINENFLNRKLSLELIRCLFADIMSTVIKIIGEININFSTILGVEVDPLGKLLQCQTINEMQNITINIFKAVGEYLASYKKNHNDLKDRIIAFIEKNYGDENLSLTQVAENLNINASYLSRFFKEQTGENFVYFLSRYRLQKAKELLKGSNNSTTINEIAGLVGYNNINTFNRVFKKHEGITPGQFKSGA